MAKEPKTAEQLAQAIARQLNIGGVVIKVMKDPVHGWSAVVPDQAIAVQAEVGNIVAELRTHYDLVA